MSGLARGMGWLNLFREDTRFSGANGDTKKKSPFYWPQVGLAPIIMNSITDKNNADEYNGLVLATTHQRKP